MKPNKSSSVELSAKDQVFCDNLLTLAKWLDSQDEYSYVYQSPVQKTGVVFHPMWQAALGYYKNESRYYHPHTTNKERVLAVLMLRSAILAGDSFV